MTPYRFRLLLVMYALSLAVSLYIGLTESGYSPQLKLAYANEPELAIHSSVPFLVLSGGLLLASFGGLAGLFLFKIWGRSVSLWSTIGLILLMPFIGPYQSAPLESFFAEIATSVWGAILALSYYSSVSGQFIRTRVSEPVRV